ncbi:torsin-3A [Spea bombifrons]|uniref:torsin-3A n=1 Tax=Spea bombifrons TaxID=233779 RepID=UPI002349116B|nr:torsin-3A [Spea bombifrons]
MSAVPGAPLLLGFLVMLGTPGVLGAGQETGGDGSWLPGAHEMQDLAQLSWEYLQCWLSPGGCEPGQQPPPGWTWPSVGWESVELLSDWYRRVSGDAHHTHGRIMNNITGLQEDLTRRVHGQHLAHDLIVTSIKSFLNGEEPRNSLVLAFHGWTGTGKNLAARIIAENLYADRQRSACIRIFIPQLHFPHASHLEAYKVQLAKQIREVSSRCMQPLFVFDEADKLPPALLPPIHAHLTQPETAQTRSIFLFLSGTGSNAINEVALSFWRAGRHREEITINDLDRPLKSAIRETQGNNPFLQHLLAEGLVDALVPFLPLERAHVKMCARDCLVARSLPYTETTLEAVTKELLFVPKGEQLFSAQGCKLVAQRINFLEL